MLHYFMSLPIDLPTHYETWIVKRTTCARCNSSLFQKTFHDCYNEKNTL